MFEWSDTDLMMRDTIRGFIDKEIRPHLDALETGEMPPYPIARKLFSEFGLDVLAAEAVKTMLDNERAKQEAGQATTPRRSHPAGSPVWARRGRWPPCWSPNSPGSASACSARSASASVSGAATIMSRGTLAQKERWLPELMTLEKIAAWAITEPDSGSDAFGGMKTTVTPATVTTTSSTGRRRSSPTGRTPTSWSSTPSSTTVRPIGATGRC